MNMRTHRLFASASVLGHLALDDPHGLLVSDRQPIALFLGTYRLFGRAEADGETFWFLADGATSDERVQLQEGMLVQTARDIEQEGIRTPEQVATLVQTLIIEYLEGLVAQQPRLGDTSQRADEEVRRTLEYTAHLLPADIEPLVRRIVELRALLHMPAVVPAEEQE